MRGCFKDRKQDKLCEILWKIYSKQGNEREPLIQQLQALFKKRGFTPRHFGDSHEWTRHLLEQLRANEASRLWVDALFDGEMVSDYRCSNCSDQFNCNDVFFEITLGSKDTRRPRNMQCMEIETLLSEYLQEDSESGLECSCEDNTSYVMKRKLIKSPKILILKIDRKALQGVKILTPLNP